MKLSELVKGLEIVDSKGSMDTEITSIVYDSRKAKPGSLFVCIDGTLKRMLKCLIMCRASG